MLEAQTIAAWSETHRWYFYQEGRAGWRWDRIGRAGELLQRSQRPFESRAQCVVDAKAHGYGNAADNTADST